MTERFPLVARSVHSPLVSQKCPDRDVSAVFGCCVPVDAECFGDGIGCFAVCDSLIYLPPYFSGDAWASNALALRLGSSHPGSGAFANLLGLDLGQRGQQGEQDIAHKLVVGG